MQFNANNAKLTASLSSRKRELGDGLLTGILTVAALSQLGPSFKCRSGPWYGTQFVVPARLGVAQQYGRCLLSVSQRGPGFYERPGLLLPTG